MIIGIDLGNTICRKGKNGQEFFPNVMETIREFIDQEYKVHIVSRVNEEQEKRTVEWLNQSAFCTLVNLPPENIHFCRERYQKAAICDEHRVELFIDDRPEVMAWMPVQMRKILFRPNPDDVFRWFNQLTYTTIQQTWLGIEGCVNFYAGNR